MKGQIREKRAATYLEEEEVPGELVAQRIRIRTVELDLEAKGVGRADLHLLADLLGVVQPVRLRVGVGVLQAKVIGLDVQADVITDAAEELFADRLLSHVQRQVVAVQQEHLTVEGPF